MELFDTEMFSEKRITELEDKIDSIIAGFLAAKDENSRLSGIVENLEAENKSLKERISAANTDREMVSSKVRKILEKIDKVEV